MLFVSVFMLTEQPIIHQTKPQTGGRMGKGARGRMRFIMLHHQHKHTGAGGLTSSGSLRLARMLPFSPGACLLGLFSLGDVSSGGGGGGGGGATFSLLGEMVSSNHSPRMGSLSSSAARERTHTKTQLPDSRPHQIHNQSCHIQTERDHYCFYKLAGGKGWWGGRLSGV